MKMANFLSVAISTVENYLMTYNLEFIYIKIIYRKSGLWKTDMICGVTWKPGVGIARFNCTVFLFSISEMEKIVFCKFSPIYYQTIFVFPQKLSQNFIEYILIYLISLKKKTMDVVKQLTEINYLYVFVNCKKRLQYTLKIKYWKKHNLKRCVLSN